jgi:hypothetical protein
LKNGELDKLSKYLYFVSLSILCFDSTYNLNCSLFLRASHQVSFIHQWFYRHVLGPGHFFSFVILYTVGRTPWTEAESATRRLPTHRIAQTQNKHTHKSMPRVLFETTTTLFERAKTVHALDRASTVIGFVKMYRVK